MTFYNRQIQMLNNRLYSREDLTERIIGAKQFIDRHYAKDIDLNTISRKACLSKYYFIRLFKKFYGQTPHQYLAEVRISKAKKLIQKGMSVRSACFEVGYNSVTSFSSLFKKITGSPPSRID